ncbi:MAG TPA: type VII secretion protein EccE [Micromonosporaceae bacterium]|nr:type VII secretion protein EccE [Micromonosporaceae bacterium]
MSVGLTDDRTRRAADEGPDRRPAARTTARPTRANRRAARFRAGQIVAVQVAAALVLAAAGRDGFLVAGAAFAAVIIAMAALVRIRRRWLFEWLATAVRFASRRHALPGNAHPAALLDLVTPGARLVPAEIGGEAAAIVDDGHGLTAVLEIGDRAGLVADGTDLLPGPASLLPPAGPDLPATRVQLLVTGAPAPAPRAGNATPATSYRQLTDGRLLGHERALVAVRVLRGEGWRDDELRRALSSHVRRVRRRLAPLPTRVLGETPLLRVLAETAHHDGGPPGREAWQAVHLGGLLQASFRLSRWPDLRTDTARRLVPRLLSLPAAATTVSVSVGPRGAGGEDVAVDFTVRLATPGSLTTAAKELRRLLSAEGAAARRLDGEHLAGLAATLPLATGAAPGPMLAAAAAPAMSAAATDALELRLGSAGLMVGANRHGEPVAVRLFRAEATRTVLIGGVRAAQLMALRAMALGARIVVQTGRPRAWEPFVRGASAPGDTLTVVPPGRPLGGATATPLQPVLVVIDVGPVAADPQPGPAWQATLVVRDAFTAADSDAVSRADLVLLQPLRPDEAALAAPALGLGGSAEWLTRIPDNMVAVVNRRALRWALLSTTPIESHLVGRPSRT